MPRDINDKLDYSLISATADRYEGRTLQDDDLAGLTATARSRASSQGRESGHREARSVLEFNNKVLKKYIRPLIEEFRSEPKLMTSIDRVLGLISNFPPEELWRGQIPKKDPTGNAFSVLTEVGRNIHGRTVPNNSATMLSMADLCCDLAISKARLPLKQELESLKGNIKRIASRRNNHLTPSMRFGF